MQTRPPETKLLSVFTGVFVAALLVSNACGSKFIELGPFAPPGAVILFPITYIFGDILTEVYGFARSRRVIWTGFGCQLGAAFFYWVVEILPPAPDWQNQEAFEKILGAVPRIAIASLAAYWFGEFCNSWVISKMKFRARGKGGVHQAWRFVASTVVGEGIDTVVFMTVAFGGTMTIPLLAWHGVSNYIFKVGYEVVAIPLTVKFADWVKRAEGIDHIDLPEETSYNPFRFFADPAPGTATAPDRADG